MEGRRTGPRLVMIGLLASSLAFAPPALALAEEEELQPDSLLVETEKSPPPDDTTAPGPASLPADDEPVTSLIEATPSLQVEEESLTANAALAQTGDATPAAALILIGTAGAGAAAIARRKISGMRE